jgi:hypothetical protein
MKKNTNLLVIRNKTNSGNKAKTYYFRGQKGDYPPALFIKRLVQIPVNNNNLINTLLDTGWKMLKTYKGTVIAEKQFVINDDSFIQVFLNLYTKPVQYGKNETKLG